MKTQKTSSKQKVYALVLLGAGVLASWMFGGNSPKVQATFHSTDVAVESSPAVVPSNSKILESAPVKSPEITLKPAVKPVVVSEKPKVAGWQVGGFKADTPTIPLNESVVHYGVVELEQHPAAFPQVGEQITLPMLDGKSVVADVQSSTNNPNGDYTWSGHIQGYGDDYPVVMTYGEHSIFATITTPEGSYTMESVNGLGWLYKNPSEFELSKPGFNDYLEVQ